MTILSFLILALLLGAAGDIAPTSSQARNPHRQKQTHNACRQRGTITALPGKAGNKDSVTTG